MRVWLHETSHASSQLVSTWLLLSRYTTTRGSTMTKRLCLLGISLRIEECTQCGASSGSSETFGESMWLTFSRSFACSRSRSRSRSRSHFRSRVSVFSSCPYYGGPGVHSDVMSAAGPPMFRIVSAMFPQFFRTISATSPQCYRLEA